MTTQSTQRRQTELKAACPVSSGEHLNRMIVLCCYWLVQYYSPDKPTLCQFTACGQDCKVTAGLKGARVPLAVEPRAKGRKQRV